MSYQSKYSGSEIDSKLDQIDNKANLTYVNEQLNEQQTQIDNKANSSDYKIKIYTDPTIFGLSYDTMTMQDIVDVLPKDTVLTFWVNGDCPNIYNAICEGIGTTNGYGNILFKKITNVVRIEFEQYSSNVTLIRNYTTTNDIGWSSWTLNGLYPIGAIYTSTVNTSPASLFGGTWEKIEGRFLFASNSNYSAGTTGGATTHTHTSAAHTHTIAGHTHSTSGHTLTISEMPSHAHKVAIGTSDNSNLTYWGECRAYGSGSNWGYGYSNTPPSNQVYAIYAGGGSSHSHGNTGSTSLTTNSTTPGATGSSSNMPPYLSVYMWKRIS